MGRGGGGGGGGGGGARGGGGGGEDAVTDFRILQNCGGILCL